jgi:hypothetical protein
MKYLLMLLTLTTVISANASTCAVAYQGEDTYGQRLDLQSGDSYRNLKRARSGHHESWDNKISSVRVMSGCTLITYQYQNFGEHYDNGRKIGFTKIYENNSSMRAKTFRWLNNMSDNRISSIKCFCL